MGFLSRFFGGRAADKDGYYQGLAGALAEKGITNCRNVGGSFKLSAEGLQKMAAIGMKHAFEEATVVVSDKPNERSAAFMVGRKADGGYSMISLQNIARPDDTGYTDKFSARRNAHFFRNLLITSGEQTRPESHQILNPS